MLHPCCRDRSRAPLPRDPEDEPDDDVLVNPDAEFDPFDSWDDDAEPDPEPGDFWPDDPDEEM